MANTLIRVKRSSVTGAPANGSLVDGQMAYSHASDKLFIGNTTGGIIEIGGRYWVNATIAAFNTANAAASGSLDVTARETANLAFIHANSAYDKANTGGDPSAFLLANIAYAHANAAFATGNGAFSKANTANNDAIAAFFRANQVYIHANTAHASANAGLATANAAITHANQAFNKANTANNDAVAAFLKANLVHVHANAAFQTANDALPKVGGTIAGDLIVTGNIAIHGHTTYTNTQTLVIGDNIFVLNADLPASAGPSENGGFIINRGNQSNVTIQWTEAANAWQFNVNNSPLITIASNVDVAVVRAVAEASFATGNGAFAKANTANNDAIAAFLKANLVHVHANAAFTKANTANNDAIAAFFRANQTFAHANAAFITANHAFAMANSATAQAANADFITTGTVVVGRGGTGLNSVATNGILYGQGTSALAVLSSSTEGHVLQINDLGVPIFAHLDGGTF